MQVQVNIQYEQRKFVIRKIDDAKTVADLKQSLATTLSVPVSQIEFLNTSSQPLVDTTTIATVLANYAGQPLQSREYVRPPMPIVTERLVDDGDNDDDELNQALIASITDYQETIDEETQLALAINASLTSEEPVNLDTTKIFDNEPTPLTPAFDKVQTPTDTVDNNSTPLPEALYLTTAHFCEESVAKINTLDIPVVTIPGQDPIVYRNGKTLVEQLIQLQDAGIQLFLVADDQKIVDRTLRPITRHCHGAKITQLKCDRADSAPANAYPLDNRPLCEQLADLVTHLPKNQIEKDDVEVIERVRNK